MTRQFNRLLGFFVLQAALVSCASNPAKIDMDKIRQEVTNAEIAFAKTMADRDVEAFAMHISDEAIFLIGDKALRGKSAVVDYWKRYFTGETPPFSWKPEIVEVLPSGALARSIGPVFNAEGKLIARYDSTWRLETPGVWRVVFDNGYEVCDKPKQ